MSRKRVKQSASQAILAPLSLPAPDRLSRLAQELFDMICNHVVNEKKAFKVRSIFALHCASKTLYDKTSAWVCKSGVMMTECGLKTLLRMARAPQVASGITHIRLFFPFNEDFYRSTTMDELNKTVSMLNNCFARFNNLRKIELKSRTLLTEESEKRFSWRGPKDYFQWSISSLLHVLYTSGACITDLIYDQGVSPWARYHYEDEEDEKDAKYPPGLLSRAQMSCLHNIEKFRVVGRNFLLNGTNWRYYTKEMFEEMPQLKELTITTPTRDFWRSLEPIWDMMEDMPVGYEFSPSAGRFPPLLCKPHEPTLPNWLHTVLNCNYDWRLTSFHLKNCRVDSLELFTNFLITHSSTLRDLSLIRLAVFDTSYIGLDCSRVAQNAWSTFFRTILDETSPTKGRFGGFTHWFYAKDRPSLVALRAAMCWEPKESLELHSSDTKFAEVAKVKGVWNALEEWREGMVMVILESFSRSADEWW